MIVTITETVLVLGSWVELSILSKATILVALGLTAVRLAGHARASVRHLLLVMTFAAMLALPLFVAIAPGVTIEVPVSQAGDSFAIPSAVSASNALVPSTSGSPGLRGPVSSRWSAPSLPTIMRAGWIAGAVLLFLPLAVDLWRLRRIRRHGLPCPEMRGLVQSLTTECGLRRSVEVLLHEDIPAPLTCGVWRPAIILPSDAREWKEADLRRAVIHELEHVRRGDWAIQLVSRATCACYWFHPLVWVAWRQLCLEAERACDDAVVQTAENTLYAEQLVSLARRLSNTHSEATPGMASRSDLSTRVSALLDGSQRRGRAGLLTSASAISIAGLIVLAIAPVRAVAKSGNPALVASREPGSRTQDAWATSPSRLDEALYQAADGGDISSIRAVAKSGNPAVVATQESGSRTQDTRANRPSRLDEALYQAAEDGDISDIERLLNAGANVNCVLDGDGSPLIGAARKGHLAAVRLLLDRGADPNLPVHGDGNPLIMAAREGHADVVTLLLDRGANIDQMVSEDENALIQASGEGHLHVVKLLVSRGADVNARAWAGRAFDRPNAEWRTPLSMARKGGHDAVVTFLLAAGARE